MKLTDRLYIVGSGIQGFDLTDASDCHVYLIDGGDELALVDAGAGAGVPEIIANIRAEGFDPQKVHYLFITHAHLDHAGGAARMVTALGGKTKVCMHSDCASFLRNGDEEAISLAAAKQVKLYPPEVKFEPCPVAIELHDGQTIRVGDLEIRAIETPGHSKGHTAYFTKINGRNVLFCGDLVFFGGRILLQRTWDCDLQAHLDSFVKLRDAKIDILLPGHRTFSLKDGQRHINAALRNIDGLLVPPNIAYAW
jgi:hydroxyacylglutathione hydrolase